MTKLIDICPDCSPLSVFLPTHSNGEMQGRIYPCRKHRDDPKYDCFLYGTTSKHPNSFVAELEAAIKIYHNE